MSKIDISGFPTSNNNKKNEIDISGFPMPSKESSPSFGDYEFHPFEGLDGIVKKKEPVKFEQSPNILATNYGLVGQASTFNPITESGDLEGLTAPIIEKKPAVLQVEKSINNYFINKFVPKPIGEEQIIDPAATSFRLNLAKQNVDNFFSEIMDKSIPYEERKNKINDILSDIDNQKNAISDSELLKNLANSQELAKHSGKSLEDLFAENVKNQGNVNLSKEEKQSLYDATVEQYNNINRINNVIAKSNEDINRLNSLYASIKYSGLGEEIPIEDEFSQAAEQNADNLKKFSMKDILQKAGEIGIQKRTFTDDPETTAANIIAYNTPKVFINSPKHPLSDSDAPAIQTEGNPEIINQVDQRNGMKTILKNYKDVLEKSKDNIDEVVSQYEQLVKDYTSNMTKEGYDNLNKYRDNVLIPAQEQFKKHIANYEQLSNIYTSQFNEVKQKEDREAVELANYDPNSFFARLQYPAKSFANSQNAIGYGFSDIFSNVKRPFMSDEEFQAERISAFNRLKEKQYYIPEVYENQPFFRTNEELYANEKYGKPISQLTDSEKKEVQKLAKEDPKGYWERLDLSTSLLKSIDVTAKSLEIAGATALTGGSNLAILPVTAAMTYGDYLSSNMKMGLSHDQASALATFQSVIEGFTELISPLETKIFNPETYTTKGLIRNLSKEEIKKQLYRALTGKEATGNVLNFLARLGKGAYIAAHTTMAETAEEVAGDLLNAYLVDPAFARAIPGYNGKERNISDLLTGNDPEQLESLKNTIITSAITMAPTGIWSGGSNIVFEKQIPSYRLEVAQRPELYLQSVIDDYKNGRTPELPLKNGKFLSKADVLNQATKEIQNLSKLYQANGLVINNLEDKADRANYLNLLRELQDVNDNIAKASPISLSESYKGKEESKLETLEKYAISLQDQIDKYNKEAYDNINLSPEDRQSRQEEKLIEATKSKFTDDFINSLFTVEQAEFFKHNLLGRYYYMPTEKVKSLIEKIAPKLENRLERLLSNPNPPEIPTREVEQTPTIEQVSTENPEETGVNHEEKIAEIVSKPEGKKQLQDLADEYFANGDVETGNIYQDAADKLEKEESEKQTEENKVAAPKFEKKFDKPLLKEQFVKIKGDDTIWQVVGNEDGKVKLQTLKKDADGNLVVDKTTNLSDDNDIEEVFSKQEGISRITNIKNNGVQKQESSNDLEAKKADIERRRQEELNNQTKKPIEVFPNTVVNSSVFHGGNVIRFTTNGSTPTTNVKGKSLRKAGIYFTTDKETAEGYAGYRENGEVYEVAVNIQNPYIVKNNEIELAQELTEEKIAELKKQGYDSVIWEDGNEVIVFDENQVQVLNNPKQINAKFDAELAALENKEQTEHVKQIKEDSQTEENAPSDRNLEIKITKSISAKWDNSIGKWIFTNSKSSEITSFGRIIEYSSKLTSVPNVIKTWWNDLLSKSDRQIAIKLLQDLLQTYEKGIQSQDQTIDYKGNLMSYLRGVKFSPNQIKGYVNDEVSLKAWATENGKKLDTFVSDWLLGELQQLGFDYDEQDVINDIIDIINEYPKGITKKDIENVISDSQFDKELTDLKEQFVRQFGLDIEQVAVKLEQEIKNIKENEEKIENKPKSESKQDIKQSQETPEVKSPELTKIQEIEQILAKQKAGLEAAKKDNAPQQFIKEIQEVVDEYEAQLAKLKKDLIQEKPDEQKQEEQKSESDKANENAQKAVNPFGTVAQQVNKKTEGKPTTDKVITTQVNTFANIQNEKLSSGKSYKQLGYTMTVMNADKVDEKYLAQDTQDALERGTYKREDLAKARIAVLTDENGNTLYFTEDGKPSSKEAGGLIVFQNLRGRIDKKGVFSLDNRISEADLAKKGMVEFYNHMLKELENVRRSNENITFEIQEITNGAPEYDAANLKNLSDFEGISLVIDSAGKLKFQFPNSQIQNDVWTNNTKVDDVEGLLDAVVALLDMNNKEGLPETLQDSELARRSYIETFFLTKQGKLQFRPTEDGGHILVRNTKVDAKNAKEYLSGAELNASRKQSLNLEFKLLSWDGKRFTEKIYPSYQDFLIQHFKTPIQGQSRLNSYVVFGDVVETKKEEKPVENKEILVYDKELAEKPQEKPRKKFTKKFEKQGGGLGETELLRRKTFRQVEDSEKEKVAKEWANSFFGISGAEFKDLRNIMNSEAYATWLKGAITLYSEGKYTDLYHEAFHDFTQMFLTKEQKVALYKEAENTEIGKKAIADEAKRLGKKVEDLTTLEKYDALEEMLAEDFYNYMTSEQKLILNQRPKRNTIFRRIYNFLKNLLVGKPSVQEIYEQLASLKIKRRLRNPENAFFGKLNRQIQVDGKPIFDYSESNHIRSAIDSIIAKSFREKGISIAELFHNPEQLGRTYNTVHDTLVDIYNRRSEEYNNLLEQENPNENSLNQLENEASVIQDILENWKQVVENHRTESKFFKISSKIFSDEIESGEYEDYLNKEKYGNDNEDSISAKDNASNQIIYLIASIPAMVNKEGVPVEKFNSLLPSIQDIADFETTWNQVAKTLENTPDYTQIWSKLEDLAKKQPQYSVLLESLPHPEEELDIYSNQLKNQFINTFSQPIVSLHYVSLEWKNDGVKAIMRSATPNTTKKLKSDWDLALQEVPNKYAIGADNEQKQLDIENLVKDFDLKFNSKITDARFIKDVKLQFLKAIGFQLSPQTIESPELAELLLPSNFTINRIYEAIKEYNQRRNEVFPENYTPLKDEVERFKKPIYSIIDIINNKQSGANKDFIERLGYVPNILKGAKDEIATIANIELQYSDKFFTDNVLNAENNSVWSIRPWSQQSWDYQILNNIDKFPDYDSLLNDPVASYFHTSTNPDADNTYIRALFDLSTGKRRTDKNGKPIQIKLYNHDGLSVSRDLENRNIREGVKTASLNRFEKAVQDISVLLSYGMKEHVRYGDKTTARGTQIEFPRYTKNQSPQNKYIPVDISDFTNTSLPEEAWYNMKQSLYSALLRTQQFYVSGIGKNWTNFDKNVNELGFFNGILSEKLENELVEACKKEGDLNKLIKKHEIEIKESVKKFFEDDAQDFLKELQNPVLEYRDFIDAQLLKNYNINTIARAFSVNSWILNSEHIRLEFQDIRFYDNKKKSYREGFKRFSKNSSTGTIAVNDDQMNAYLNSLGNAEREQYQTEHPETQLTPVSNNGFVNTAIFEDVSINAEEYINAVAPIFKQEEDFQAFKDAYGDMKTTDAFGICSFDFYREFKLRTGNDAWSTQKEQLYQKIAKKEALTEDEKKSAFLFFAPLKIRVVGRTWDNTTKQWIPVDYKFAVSPLIDSVVNDKVWGDVKNNMIRQNISIATFKSASKHSSVNSNGKFNQLYIDGKPNTADYVTNPVRIEYIYEVVSSPDDYKEEVTFSTQQRDLLFVNQFDEGVPHDYEGKEDFLSLSESEKKKASPIYSKFVEFGDIIAEQVQNEADKLLKRLDATVDEKGNFQINEDKFSELLEDEFKKRGLPDNVLKSVIVKDGKFKYPLDASIKRDTIEKVILSIVDNKLRKQKAYGEGLIQASSIGYEPTTFKRVDSWEKTGGNDLPFYNNEGRTLKNGKKVTSAHKVKIALQGNFKNLLQHPDVLEFAAKEQITPLQALNQLIKDESWLDKDNNRVMVSLTGVRIPVQGPNSMDFMEVYEFLPTEAGNVIIVSPALVAKSGGDFDWDKITTLFPYTFFNKYSKELKYHNLKDTTLTEPELVKTLKEVSQPSKKNLKELTEIRKQLKEDIEEYKSKREEQKQNKDKIKYSLRQLDIEIAFLNQNLEILEEAEFALNNEDDIKSLSEQVLQTVGLEGLKEATESAISETKQLIFEKINESKITREFLLKLVNSSLEEIRNDLNYSRQSLDKLNQTINPIKEYLSNIEDLIYKASIKKARHNRLNEIIREVLESPENFEQLVTPNSTSMFEPVADKIMEATNKKKASYSIVPTAKESLNQFESNMVGKATLGIGAVQNSFFPKMQAAGLYLNKYYKTNLESDKTSKEAKNRLPHNKTKEGNISLSKVKDVFGQSRISESISQLMNGWVDVAKKDWIFYINGRKEVAPVMLLMAQQGVPKDINIAFNNQPSIKEFVKNLQTYKSNIVRMKNESLYYDSKKNAIYDTLIKWLPSDYTIEKTDKFGKTRTINVKNALKEAYETGPMEYWGFLNSTMRQVANENQNLFDYDFMKKFAIPENKTLQIPTTEKEKLAQAAYLIQFLEFQEQQGILENIRRATNQDRAKPADIQSSQWRKQSLNTAKQYQLVAPEIIDRIANNSTTKGFSGENGIDQFAEKLTNGIFEITNSKLVNDFLLKEWNKSEKDSNIKFQSKSEIRDKWIRDFKSDLILYLYQNYVYKPNTAERVVNDVVRMMRYDTSLATEVEKFKLKYPEIAENNLFLSYLTRDNSTKKINGKPEVVSLKIRKQNIDNITSDILTQDFEKLMNFDDPDYSSETHMEAQTLAKKIAYFAFIQSGLSKSDISFSELIPQESYAEDIAPIISAFKDMMENDPNKAKTILSMFYRLFKRNHRELFRLNEKQYSQEANEFYYDIDFNTDVKRFKNYIEAKPEELLNKNATAQKIRQEAFKEALKKKVEIRTALYTKTTAKDSPKTLFVYDELQSRSGLLGNAIVLGSRASTIPENTTGIVLRNKPSETTDAYFSDKDLTRNKNLINNSVQNIIQKMKEGGYEKLVIPQNLLESSKLAEKAPQTYMYLREVLLDNFGFEIPDISTKFVETGENLEASEITEEQEFQQWLKQNQDPLLSEQEQKDYWLKCIKGK